MQQQTSPVRVDGGLRVVWSGSVLEGGGRSRPPVVRWWENQRMLSSGICSCIHSGQSRDVYGSTFSWRE